MAKLYNRARMTISSTGTGTLTLGSAVTGYQTFASAGVANGDVVSYAIEDGANWEIGTGTYTSSGTTLSRTPSASSNAGGAISVTTSAQVYISALVADLVSIANGKTVVVNNSLTLAGTDSTTITFPSASATVAGLGTTQTFTGTQTFAGTSSALAAVFSDAAEVATISATAATGTINYDVSTQSVLYYTTNASANWTVNFRHSSGSSLNSVMTTGQSITVAFLVTQGATAYYNNAVTVDGTSVTPKWQSGTAPTAGNASSIDIYTYTILKTGSAAFTVFATQTKFA